MPSPSGSARSTTAMSTGSRDRWARASFREPAVVTAKPSCLAISASPARKSSLSSMRSACSMRMIPDVG